MRSAYRRHDATPSAADRSDKVLPRPQSSRGRKVASFPCGNLIDTGADECVLPYEDYGRSDLRILAAQLDHTDDLLPFVIGQEVVARPVDTTT